MNEVLLSSLQDGSSTPNANLSLTMFSRFMLGSSRDRQTFGMKSACKTKPWFAREPLKSVEQLIADGRIRPMLNERAQILLKTLVERYISEGQPVGSRALLQYSGLEISPATIRNVMSELEDIGLVSSPHTSAGRVPTGLAYRLFIDTMLVTKPLDSTRVQQMENQLQPDNPSRLIAQASNILSELTHFAGVVATAKRSAITVRQIEFLRLGEKRVLLIIVMPDGEVENRVLLLERDYTQSQLTEAGNFLNQNYIGCSFSQIRDRLRGELRQLHQDMSALMTAALAAGDAAQAKQSGITSSAANTTCCMSKTCPPT